MTHDELLEKIDWIGKTKDSESRTATPLGVAVLASLNALRAVVELHKPKHFIENNEVYCSCSLSPLVTYPCQTVQIIERELK